MKLEKILFTTLLGLSLASCGNKTSNNESASEATQTKAVHDKSAGWSESEKKLFTDKGTNNLGFEVVEYDYAVVVKGDKPVYLTDTNAEFIGEDTKDSSTSTSSTDMPPSDSEEAENKMKPANTGDDSDAEKGKPETVGNEKSQSASESAGKEKDKIAKTDEEGETEDEAETEEEAESEEENEEKAVKEPTEAEIAQCSKHFDEDVKGLKISGNKNTAEISKADIVAVRLTGNQSSVNILLTSDGEGTESIKGVCIIATGNKPATNLVLTDVNVGKVVYMASGNSSTAAFEVSEESTMTDFEANLKGKDHSLSVSGDGTYSCEKISSKGKDANVTCSQ